RKIDASAATFAAISGFPSTGQVILVRGARRRPYRPTCGHSAPGDPPVFGVPPLRVRNSAAIRNSAARGNHGTGGGAGEWRRGDDRREPGCASAARAGGLLPDGRETRGRGGGAAGGSAEPPGGLHGSGERRLQPSSLPSLSADPQHRRGRGNDRERGHPAA